MDAKTAAAARIDDGVAAQARAVQPILHRIRAIVREEAPGAQETISYRMPAFMLGGARSHFAALKKHIGIHPPVHGDAALPQAPASQPQLAQYHLLPGVMADLLSRPGRPGEARAMWLRAAELTRNARERELLLARAHNPPPEGGKP